MMMFEVIKVLSPDGITTLRPRLATSSHTGDAMATRTTSGQVATRETWQNNFWNTARDCLAACGGTADCLAPPDAGPCDGRWGHHEIVNISTSPDLLNQVNSILLGPSTGGLRDFWVRRLCREHQQLLVVGPVQRQLSGLGGEEYWKNWIWSFNGGGDIGGSKPL